MEKIKEIMDDLAGLYSSLNHGDDSDLLQIAHKHGYTFDYVDNKYVAIIYTDEMRKEDEDWAKGI